MVAMVASAFAGVVLYKLVERPLLQWLSGKKRRQRQATGYSPAWSRRSCRATEQCASGLQACSKPGLEAWLNPLESYLLGRGSVNAASKCRGSSR